MSTAETPANDEAAPSVRDQQQTVVVTLAELLRADLPPLHWHISAFDFNALELEGTTSHLLSDAETRAAIEAWANHLGAEVTERRTDTVHLGRIRTRYGVVAVYVWGHIGHDDEPAGTEDPAPPEAPEGEVR